MPFASLIHALTEGATVITPTNRLQREILWLFSESQAKSVLTKPKCFAYETWVTNWYQDYFFQHPQDLEYTLIDNQQLSYLWKKFHQEITGRELKSFECQQALSALKNCELTLTVPEGSDFLYHPSAQIFQKIWEKLQVYLHQHQLIPPYRLASILKHIHYPIYSNKIVWACFDMFHPQQLALIEHLEQLGIEQVYFDFNQQAFASSSSRALSQLQEPNRVIEQKLYLAEDDEDELQQIVLWIKQQQNLGKKRIGLIVPNLSQQLNKIQNRLRQHFKEKDLHFSLGQTLFDYPIIKHGLVILSIYPNIRLSREHCRLLLRSPFIHGYHEEKEARNQIALKHKLLQEPEIPFTHFIDILEQSCPILANTLKTLSAPPKNTSITEYLDYLTKQLEKFKFAQNTHFFGDSEAILQKFYLNIEELHRLSLFTSKLSFQALISELETRFKQQIHQPPQDYDGIHVMGWLESSGFTGDALWICNFISQLIPQPIHLSSLLPLNWQKKNKLPRTDAHKETQIATQMFQRLLHGQTAIVISYAKHIEQQPQWPSPLLPKNMEAYEGLSEVEHAAQLEIVEDNYQLPIKLNEEVKGGSHLMSSHAKCPFQAFAKYRLHAQESNPEGIGLNPLERGQLLHQALFHIWSTLKAQEDLFNLAPKALKELIEKSIDKSLQPVQELKPYSLDPFLNQLEREHLTQLIEQALEIDRNRPHFRILGLEKEIQLKIDDWAFQLRYDRIDILDNGEHCVIDYKTSLPSPLPWYSTKPIYPQILMYALADSKIQALLFMALKIQESQVSGLAANDVGIQGVKKAKEEWVTLEQQWLTSLEGNIEEIKAGICPPKPIQASTCQQCKYQDICRLDILEEAEN
jgi:hypothetical protein